MIYLSIFNFWDCLFQNTNSLLLIGYTYHELLKDKKNAVLNTHIAPFDINNFNFSFCDTDTYANQSLYTNLVNNFVRFRGERVCTINLKTLMRSFLSFNNS